MDTTTVRKFRWFWAWQDHKEEAWLEEMSAKGLHLKSGGIAGLYTFEVGEPRELVYRLDYASPGRDRAEYLQLFRDSGWEHIQEVSGWQYFRKKRKPGAVNEIYTDNQSKAQKYRRLLFFLMILVIPLWISLVVGRSSGEVTPWMIYRIGRMLLIVLLPVLIYAILRIALRIRELHR